MLVLRAATARRLATALPSQPLERHTLTNPRRRRLFLSGNKATLITRVQHAQKCASGPASNESAFAGRALATAATTPARPTLDVKLPDLSSPEDIPGPHIPFLPDSWDSSRARTADAIHHSPTADSPMPMVLVMTGSVAHHPGGLSHSAESDEDHDTREAVAGDTDLWGDVATDLGLPNASDAMSSLIKARDMVSAFSGTSAETEHKTRPLNVEETKGVWILLGLLGGSWLAAGLFSDSNKK